MNSQENIQDELNEMNSILPAQKSGPVFTVPEGYFEGLPAAILAKVKDPQMAAGDELQEISPLLAGISKQMPYSVPLLYFQENIDNLPGITQNTDASFTIPVGRDMPFTIPENYFTGLSQQVMARVMEPPSKVVLMFARTWMRAAVAAVVGGIIFISGYQYYSAKAPDTVAEVPVDTSHNWVARTEPAVVKDLEKISTKDLDEFIATIPEASKSTTKKAPVADHEKVKELLRDVSDSEMDEFLNSIPADKNDLTATE